MRQANATKQPNTRVRLRRVEANQLDAMTPPMQRKRTTILRWLLRRHVRRAFADFYPRCDSDYGLTRPTYSVSQLRYRYRVRLATQDLQLNALVEQIRQ